MKRIPAWLEEKLASPPEQGAGVHAWLFSCARQLHAHYAPAEIERVLLDSVGHMQRAGVYREIREAVRNSEAIAWRFEEGAAGPAKAQAGPARPLPPRPPAKPRACPVARAARLLDAGGAGVCGLYDLWERSPRRMEAETAPAYWLGQLFAGAELLCLASGHPRTAATRPVAEWLGGAADNCDLIVPSPMVKPRGLNQAGQLTPRALSNTGPRRWLVVEFDSGPIDEQAQLHWYLARAGRVLGWPELRLVVHSAGKSLHGWFGPCEGRAAQAEDLFGYALSLGADPATWTRCQLVRLPDGMRERDGQRLRQQVFYFNPIPQL